MGLEAVWRTQHRIKVSETVEMRWCGPLRLHRRVCPSVSLRCKKECIACATVTRGGGKVQRFFPTTCYTAGVTCYKPFHSLRFAPLKRWGTQRWEECKCTSPLVPRSTPQSLHSAVPTCGHWAEPPVFAFSMPSGFPWCRWE